MSEPKVMSEDFEPVRKRRGRSESSEMRAARTNPGRWVQVAPSRAGNARRSVSYRQRTGQAGWEAFTAEDGQFYVRYCPPQEDTP